MSKKTTDNTVTLRLEKSYYHKRVGGSWLVTGKIALREDEVEQFKKDVAARRVKIGDERIQWDPDEMDEIDQTRDQWEYEDWSFGICEEEIDQENEG